MLRAVRATRTSSRVAPNFSGSMVIQVSQKFASPYEARGINSMPDTGID
jgi:hypothetical protein